VPDLGGILRSSQMPGDESIVEVRLVRHGRIESRVPAVKVASSFFRYWIIDARTGELLESPGK
jgi:hypothetical protein